MAMCAYRTERILSRRGMRLATALTWAYLVVLVNMPGPAAGAEYWQQPVTFVTEAGSNFDENSQLLPADNPGVPLSSFVQPGCRTYDMNVDQVSPTIRDHMKAEHLVDLQSFAPLRMCERMPFCNSWGFWEPDSTLFDTQALRFAPGDAGAAEWVVSGSSASADDDVARAPLFNKYQYKGSPDVTLQNSGAPAWTSLPCQDGACVRKKRCLRSGINRTFIEGKMQATLAGNGLYDLWGEPATDGCDYMFVSSAGYYLVTAYTELFVIDSGMSMEQRQAMPRVYSPAVASTERDTVILVHRLKTGWNNGGEVVMPMTMCTSIDLMGLMDKLPCSSNGAIPSFETMASTDPMTTCQGSLPFRYHFARWERIVGHGGDRNSYNVAFKGFSVQLQDFLYDDAQGKGRELTDWYSYDIHNTFRSMAQVLVGVNYTGTVRNRMTLEGQSGWLSDRWRLNNEYAKDMVRKVSLQSTDKLLPLLNGHPESDADGGTKRMRAEYESATDVMADGAFGLVCALTATETATVYPESGIDTYEVLAGCAARTNAIKRLGEVMAGRRQGEKLSVSAEIGGGRVDLQVDEAVAAQITTIWDPVLRTLCSSDDDGTSRTARDLGVSWEPSPGNQEMLGPCQLQAIEPILRSPGYGRLDQVTGTTLAMCPSAFAEGEDQGMLLPMRAVWFGVLVSVVTSILTVISNDKLGERFPLKDGLLRADLRAVRVLQALNFVTAFLSGTYLAADVKETLVGPSVELMGFVATQTCENNSAPAVSVALPVYGEHDVRVAYTEDIGHCSFATSVSAAALVLFAADIAVSLITFAYVWCKFDRPGRAGGAPESPKLGGLQGAASAGAGLVFSQAPDGDRYKAGGKADKDDAVLRNGSTIDSVSTTDPVTSVVAVPSESKV